ncbi:MAG: sigma-70 family RNA polymerase sigma factor [Flavobacteriales bacterium]|nr:sigma-70 family RNA polymerase sigma factor [Flavobacteriales bacterium]
MLLELSKKDQQWREIAFKICHNKMLADDLVHDMYLKLRNCKKQIDDFYVIVVIRNLFLDHLKQESKKVNIDLFYNLHSKNTKFELDDREEKILNDMYWLAKGYLEMSQSMSLRKMAEELNTNYMFIYRTIKKAKDKLN